MDLKMERTQIIDWNPALTYMSGKDREYVAFHKYLEEVTGGNECGDKTHGIHKL